MRSRFPRLFAATLVLLAVSLSAAMAKEQKDPDAVFNVESKIYHRMTCAAARRCTRNCVVMKLSEARRRGGRACKICRGPMTGIDDASRDGQIEQFQAEIDSFAWHLIK
jgi:methylphosphotriester-DNA--protein-cysteine methyltransferase